MSYDEKEMANKNLIIKTGKKKLHDNIFQTSLFSVCSYRLYSSTTKVISMSILLEYEDIREIFLSLSRVINSNLNNKIRIIRLLIGKKSF